MKLGLQHTWLLIGLVGLLIFAAPLLHLVGVKGMMEPGTGLLEMANTALFGLVTFAGGVLFYLRTEAHLNA
jgi:hypothetical protein